LGARSYGTSSSAACQAWSVDIAVRAVTTTPHSINCDSNYTSADKKCPVFFIERNIQVLKVKEGLTFLKARKKFLEPKQNTYKGLT